jgi:dCTP diphosphatase
VLDPIASDSVTTIDQLKQEIDHFADQRGWQRFHTPKNLATSISIESAELLEHFQWTEGGRWREGETTLNVAAVGEEMVDVLSYLLRLASVLGIDLTQAMAQKLEKNARKYPVSGTQ